MGGMAAAIESGFARRLIDQAGYEWSMQIERKERIVVGVNDYTDDRAAADAPFEVGEEIRQREIERLNQVKARRDQRAVNDALAALGRPPRTRRKISCRRSLTPCGPTRPSARSAAFSARFSANMKRATDS